VPGIPSSALTPRETWADKDAFDRQASRLVEMFLSNFEKFEGMVGPEVRRSGPRKMAAAA
jgi:phosphoenolpyruvate carboxykinase (ATP)